MLTYADVCVCWRMLTCTHSLTHSLSTTLQAPLADPACPPLQAFRVQAIHVQALHVEGLWTTRLTYLPPQPGAHIPPPGRVSFRT